MAPATEAPATTQAEGPTSHTHNQLDALAARLEQLLQQTGPSAGTYGYTREEQIAALHRLREPFDPREVRYRPQPWCKACSNTKGWPKVCEHHKIKPCQNCNGQKITEAHICLKYIGHAEATNRLLNVDPFWDWEPLSLDQAGLPQYDGNRGLWIRLTVCGMTRIGYGDADGKTGGNAVKEIIGDAIRNAGMRFGMALNLWTSSELQILEPGVELAPELAAELGAPTGGAERDRPAAEQRPVSQSDQAEAAVLDKLMLQAAQNRSNPLVLSQVRGEAEAKGVLNHQVQGPPPERRWMPFHELLTLLLNAAQGGSTGRNAA
jgi:hypothetical protein